MEHDYSSVSPSDLRFVNNFFFFFMYSLLIVEENYIQQLKSI